MLVSFSFFFLISLLFLAKAHAEIFLPLDQFLPKFSEKSRSKSALSAISQTESPTQRVVSLFCIVARCIPGQIGKQEPTGRRILLQRCEEEGTEEGREGREEKGEKRRKDWRSLPASNPRTMFFTAILRKSFLIWQSAARASATTALAAAITYYNRNLFRSTLHKLKRACYTQRQVRELKLAVWLDEQVHIFSSPPTSFLLSPPPSFLFPRLSEWKRLVLKKAVDYLLLLHFNCCLFLQKHLTYRKFFHTWLRFVQQQLLYQHSQHQAQRWHSHRLLKKALKTVSERIFLILKFIVFLWTYCFFFYSMFLQWKSAYERRQYEIEPFWAWSSDPFLLQKEFFQNFTLFFRCVNRWAHTTMLFRLAVVSVAVVTVLSEWICCSHLFSNSCSASR